MAQLGAHHICYETCIEEHALQDKADTVTLDVTKGPNGEAQLEADDTCCKVRMEEHGLHSSKKRYDHLKLWTEYEVCFLYVRHQAVSQLGPHHVR